MVATRSTCVDRGIPIIGQLNGGTPIDGGGTGTTPTSQIPPGEPHMEIDDLEDVDPQVANSSKLWLTCNNSCETLLIINMNSFNTSSWKTRGTLKANVWSRMLLPHLVTEQALSKHQAWRVFRGKVPLIKSPKAIKLVGANQWDLLLLLNNLATPREQLELHQVLLDNLMTPSLETLQRERDLLPKLQETDLQGVRDDVRCKIFPATLIGVAQQWYLKLSPRSIYSWKVDAFGNQFAPFQQREIEPNDLVDVKRQEDEPLKDYIQRFLEASIKAKSLSEDARVMALVAGLKEMSPLWSDLRIKAVYTMNDFLYRAYGFIKLKEVVTRAKGLKGGKKKSLNSETPATKVQYRSNGGKRENNGGKPGNSIGGIKPKTRVKPL
uniref:Retrotransposon gag domain-containing protein n=1 Tax=Cannabis sativa TaxID=3483 RepID=A0A803NJA0_CANSA